jgi:soluble lytic murein transglycosylase-like protein
MLIASYIMNRPQNNCARLAGLAAAVVLFSGFYTYTPAEAANTLVVASLAPPHLQDHAISSTTRSPVPAHQPTQNMQVLTSGDITLYREAFAAQENNDWAKADHALAQVHDRLLEGHVLADRYQRRPATNAELRNWLIKYSDLPEASDFSDQVQAMPGPKGPHPKLPDVSDAWSGGREGASPSFGFKPEDDSDIRMSKEAARVAAKINNDIRRDKAAQAESVLKAELAKHKLPAAEVASLQARVAAGYFYDGQYDAAHRIARVAAAGNSPLGLWINGLTAWHLGDAVTAAQSFARLAVQPGLSSWDHAAAAFWAYRACKLAGNGAQANYWLRQASSLPHSFYGLMASHLLAHNIVWSWEVPRLTNDYIGIIGEEPAGRRALALLQIEQTGLAEAELRHLNPRGQRNLQSAMLAVAEKNHMAGLAVQLGGLATNDNGKPFDAALYPVPSWQPNEGFQVDRALMYALIRHESGFNPRAVSGAGACGLMQLMPTTAKLMANDNDVSRKCSARMFQPGYNMSLGQKYVRLLASQPVIGDNLVLLLTAYNSGPSKVSQLMSQTQQNDPLFFVESLPVRETRSYVEQVMMHYWSYRARLNKPETSLAQLARGEWPRYALHEDAGGVKILKADVANGFSVASK